jgi:hypothetical protein
VTVAKHSVKPCEECGKDSVTGERYCKGCRKAILSVLDASGYLTPRVWARAYRDPDKMAATNTGGDPSPWLENAIRAMEDGAEQV